MALHDYVMKMLTSLILLKSMFL